MDDLSTRTVAQLKALCKERGIKGYTKLTKPDLIQKITAFLAGTKTGATTSQSPNTAAAATASSGPPHHDNPELPAAPASASGLPLARHPANTSSPPSAGENIVSVSHFRSDQPASLPSRTPLGSMPANLAKRRRTKSPQRPTAPDRTPVFKAPALPSRPAASSLAHAYTSASVSPPPSPWNSGWPRLTSSYKPLASSTKPLEEHPHLTASSVSSTSRGALDSTRLKPARPFRPLQPMSPAPTVGPPLNNTIANNAPAQEFSGRQLDFSLSQLPPQSDLSPRRITLPMSLRQRPIARKWAILLTRLTDAERSQMVLVSKAMRYAVYLSAAHILDIDFQGARLASYLRSVRDPEVVDFWPYLRARQDEAEARRAAYDASFLPAFFKSQGVLSPISQRLWASPDNENQMTIVIRFLVAKAWFAVSLPDSPDKVQKWLHSTVVDAKEISKGAVWSITQQQPIGRVETLHVVYETGEVIGQSTSLSPAVDIPIRRDWAEHLSTIEVGRSSLMELVVWHNGEEYERGISKLWLSRVPDGDARRRVAERYVLACVAPNSVSGAYKTVRQIADEFASLGDSVPGVRKKDTPPAPLSLYLPEHHYVESVSFHSAVPVQPLHPALAAVQTPGREYIVLRDTGMHVGCEEDGVAEVWMKILGCDARGVAVRA